MKTKPCLSMKQLSERSPPFQRGAGQLLHAVFHILDLQHTSLKMPRLQMKYYLKNNIF